MRRFAVFSVALAACGRCGSPATMPTAIVQPAGDANVVVEAAAPVAESICVSFERKLDRELHAAIDALGDASPRYASGPWTPEAYRSALEQSGLGCVPFASGAWILEPAKEVDVENDLLITTEVRVRAIVDGRDIEAWTPEYGLRVGYGAMPTSLARAVVTDYDGDGTPELWARTDEDGVEGGHFSQSWILTARGSKVAEYAAAKDLGEIGKPEDVDGDGRLDLFVSLGIAAREDGDCFGKPTMRPADLLAHSLGDGSFSTTDDVAMKHARKWCAALPARIRTSAEALCARLRTAKADVAGSRARLAASCIPWDCAREYDGKPQKPGASHACADMLATFDQDMPITLR